MSRHDGYEVRFRKNARSRGVTVTGSGTMVDMNKLVRTDDARWNGLIKDHGIEAG